jgi:pectate lyase
VRYNVSDSAGNAADQVTRSVNVTASSGGSTGRAWEAVLSEASGFARNVTGGASGQLITVTNLNDSGSGSLRSALLVSGRKWIRFSSGLTGTINLRETLDVTSNTTIDGRGANITLDWGNNGYGFYIANRSNIIMMYLKLQNTQYDTVHFRDGFNGGWLHHITMGKANDEQMSIRNGADNITISWCRLNASDKGALLRPSSEISQYSSMYSHVTLHHNYWTSGLNQRSPKMANRGYFHIYNDYNAGDAGIHVVNNAQLLLENSILEPTTSGRKKLDSTQTDLLDGLSRATGNLLLNGADLETLNSGNVFIPPYSYSPDPATTATRDRIKSEAGWQNVPFPQ